LPNVYPIALLLTEEKLTSSSPTTTTTTNDTASSLIYNDFNSYTNSTELYLTVNARYFAKNSTKYAMRCELFLQNEYAKLFVQRAAAAVAERAACHLNLANKLVYLSQTEFHQIVLWSCEFRTTSDTGAPLAHFDAKINQINELLCLLSLKIQPQN